ncbi:hypothetical protein [Geotalea daltonii]|nr:hypothetical protein [Geotalea daltonii]
MPVKDEAAKQAKKTLEQLKDKVKFFCTMTVNPLTGEPVAPPITIKVDNQ